MVTLPIPFQKTLLADEAVPSTYHHCRFVSRRQTWWESGADLETRKSGGMFGGLKLRGIVRADKQLAAVFLPVSVSEVCGRAGRDG